MQIYLKPIHFSISIHPHFYLIYHRSSLPDLPASVLFTVQFSEWSLHILTRSQQNSKSCSLLPTFFRKDSKPLPAPARPCMTQPLPTCPSLSSLILPPLLPNVPGLGTQESKSLDRECICKATHGIWAYPILIHMSIYTFNWSERMVLQEDFQSA